MKLKHEISAVTFVLALMFVLTLVSATEYYQLDASSRLEFTCTIDNAVPSGSTTYNISVTHRRTGEVLVNNNQTTALGQGTFETYVTFNQTGTYSIKSYCYDSNLNYSSSEDIFVNHYGEETTTTMMVSDIVLLLAVFLLLLFIHYKHKGTDFKAMDDKIIQEHKHMGQTMAKAFVHNLFKRTFIWLYFIGWFIVLIIQDIILRVNTANIYEYFTLFANVYSLGLYLVVLFMIGTFASYMRDTIQILSDNNWGLDGDGQ